MMQGVQSRWGRGSRPIVLALSNPSEVAECTAQQAYNWSGGKAVYASGTAFPPFQTEEGMNVPAQANNSLIFPGGFT
jgi:malate dehydrogenase (oxaloacetate-decarboxylating)(NADP+)